MSNNTSSYMFSEAEQSELQSFITDLEKDHSSQHKSDAESSTSKKRRDYKRKTPYDRKSNSPEEETTSGRTGRARKPAHELLSEDQKKANHIASEQKRRANIKIGFDQLVDMVPSLDGSHRSESLVLQKSVDYIRDLVKDKDDLKERIRELQTMLGELPDEDNSEDDMEHYR